jgi:hypothetical protein
VGAKLNMMEQRHGDGGWHRLFSGIRRRQGRL